MMAFGVRRINRR